MYIAFWGWQRRRILESGCFGREVLWKLELEFELWALGRVWACGFKSTLDWAALWTAVVETDAVVMVAYIDCGGIYRIFNNMSYHRYMYKGQILSETFLVHLALLILSNFNIYCNWARFFELSSRESWDSTVILWTLSANFMSNESRLLKKLSYHNTIRLLAWKEEQEEIEAPSDQTPMCSPALSLRSPLRCGHLCDP